MSTRIGAGATALRRRPRLFRSGWLPDDLRRPAGGVHTGVLGSVADSERGGGGEVRDAVERMPVAH